MMTGKNKDSDEKNPEDVVALHAKVKGRVQGVGFRHFVIRSASELGLTGWVRNTYDGDVEVMAEGDRSQLERLLNRLRTGPPVAFVSDVEIEWQPATGRYKGFSVRFSG
jgi:acylphosphatase